MMHFTSRSRAIAASLLVLGGCGGGVPEDPDAGPRSARAVFDLAPDPMPFGAIPFPDDLYLADGTIALGTFPGEEQADPTTLEALRAALRTLDGFGVMTPVYVPITGGAIDPTSLPSSPAASTAPDASVFLLDVDPGSPDAFQRIPVVVGWDAASSLIWLQPLDGAPLAEGRRYAAVVTSRVRGQDGAPLAPAPAYVAIRDAPTRPADPLTAEVYDEHAPVLASLVSNGVPREDVVALAVFRVQSVGDELAAARARLRAGAPPTIRVERVVGPDALDALLGSPEMDVAGVDVPGGVRHAHVGWVIDGTFPGQEAASPRPGVHGAWTFRDGELVVHRQDPIWFTLVLPAGIDPSRLPVIVYQHGLGGQRGDVFAVADALCAAGFAVAAIDIPYHGMRTTGGPVDETHQYGSSPGPDLYGDLGGQVVYTDYLGIADDAGPLVAFHPFYVRDVLRQSVLDLMTLVFALEQADWSAVGAMGGPAPLGFADEELGFVGVSLGGILGTVFVANEPRVGAALLSVTGGHLARLVERSATFGPTFLTILMPRLGLSYDDVDWEAMPASAMPAVAIFQTLLDRGDSMAHARRLGARPVHVLMHEARFDETVPNVATEALAAAIGMPIAEGDASYVPLERVALPQTANVSVAGAPTSRALVVWEPATHGMLSRRVGESRWEPPPDPPFRARMPTPVDNPIDAAQAQMQHFFATWREGGAEIAAPLD